MAISTHSGMSNSKYFRVIAVALVAGLVAAGAAHAQATRTWVSGVGDDANPCSRTAPCKTFAGAISKTAIGGEIDVLDPGGFGAVTITKSISIEANGVIAGVLVSGTNGIIVSTGINDVVMIRGLTIEGLGTGLAGISFTGGGTLYVDGCWINNFTAKGINFAPTAAGTSHLVITNTNVHNNLGANSGGIQIAPSGAGVSADAMIENTHADHNQFGIGAFDNSKVNIKNTTVYANTFVGFSSFSTSAAVNMFIDHGFAGSNGQAGVRSHGASSTVFVTGTSLANNATGFLSEASGVINSFSNNYNNTTGAPTTTTGPQ